MLAQLCPRRKAVHLNTWRKCGHVWESKPEIGKRERLGVKDQACTEAFIRSKQFTEPNLCQVIFLAAGDVAGKQRQTSLPLFYRKVPETQNNEQILASSKK